MNNGHCSWWTSIKICTWIIRSYQCHTCVFKSTSHFLNYPPNTIEYAKASPSIANVPVWFGKVNVLFALGSEVVKVVIKDVPSITIFLPVSIIAKVPVLLGNVAILSDVGSSTVKVVSKAFSTFPSNTKSAPFNTISFVVVLPLFVAPWSVTAPAPPTSFTILVSLHQCLYDIWLCTAFCREGAREGAACIKKERLLH